jgi:hypothetical protein
MTKETKPEPETDVKTITTKHITVNEKGPNRTRYTQVVETTDHTGLVTFKYRRGSKVKR